MRGLRRFLSYILVHNSIPSSLLVPMHMPSQPLLCIPSFHELVHVDSVRLLPETSSVLPCIEHLHDSKHSTHSGTRALCPLIPIPHHSIVVVLYPGCLCRIHLRKGSCYTGGELVAMLLTNLAHNLKGYHLCTFQMDSSLGLSCPALALWCLGMDRNNHPHHKPRIPLHIVLGPKIVGRLYIPRKVQHPLE
jgi:hypothetical protein